MHIVLGVISAIAGLIWAFVALKNSGFRIESLNPFAFFRRTRWKKVYGTKPVFNLSNSMEVAAVLILGVAKCEGEISAEQKKNIQDIFVNEFRLNENEASELFVATTYLLRDEIYLADNIKNIIEKSISDFSQTQRQSTVELMTKVGKSCSDLNMEQNKLIAATQTYFEKLDPENRKW